MVKWFEIMCYSHLENFKSGNIQDSDEVLSLVFCIEGFVYTTDEPFEYTIINGLR